MRQATVQISLSDNDGPAKALLEGAACGLATLATEESCFPTGEGELGFTISRQTPRHTIEKLRWMIDHPEECRMMGRRAAEFAAREFSWETFRERFRRCLAELK